MSLPGHGRFSGADDRASIRAQLLDEDLAGAYWCGLNDRVVSRRRFPVMYTYTWLSVAIAVGVSSPLSPTYVE